MESRNTLFNHRRAGRRRSKLLETLRDELIRADTLATAEGENENDAQFKVRAAPRFGRHQHLPC
ncbi:hypothetical protein FB472_1365 [Rhodoglobus vestalii]|uniref:Uncharacterized protein n=1 Tax=Rhodoglobus vestalii TaxID=193384 RepID=A0A8H2K6N7_9MICO|nr:hypothetical protein FB472_1365 [Rhodoglobus vestalii]